jgi:RimJ/RimL family protein N-acetyltransferase
METQTIRSARLELTPLTVADADEMVDVLGDPSLYRFTGGEPPTLEQLVRRYTAQVAGAPAGTGEGWHNWIVRPSHGGPPMGYVQATITNGGARAEIAWVIGAEFQGNGYAAESASAMVAALGAAGVSEVVAHIHPDHAASNAVAARVGLEPTERLVDGEREWRLMSSSADDRRGHPLSVV